MPQSLTKHDAVAEKQLVELRGEGGEEESERGHQPAHDGRQAGGLAPAHGHRQRRDEQ